MSTHHIHKTLWLKADRQKKFFSLSKQTSEVIKNGCWKRKREGIEMFYRYKYVYITFLWAIHRIQNPKKLCRKSGDRVETNHNDARVFVRTPLLYSCSYIYTVYSGIYKYSGQEQALYNVYCACILYRYFLQQRQQG